MWKKIVLSLIILILGAGAAFFVYKTEPKLNKNFESQKAFFKKFPFRLGLDLSGGSHLIYKADVSAVKSGEVSDAMDALRDVIERRVNLFGVSEPVVQVQHAGLISGAEEQLLVDLPGVTDVKKAIDMIGQTPLLEFKVEAPKDKPQTATVDKDGKVNLDVGSQFVATELTGRYLQKATLEFDQNTREPRVSLQFNEEGAKLFAKITKENVGKMVAIYLDGAPVSTPVVNEEIPNGQAVISGNFNPQEARLLVGRLNSGALPVPITLVSTQTIGATLGESAINAGVKAAIIGFLLVALFLILWYRLPGLIAVVALAIYVALVLASFKIGISSAVMIIFAVCLILAVSVHWFFALVGALGYIIFMVIPGALAPVTLTSAGIAGFIISIGIAVDANVLIFERIKEELKGGRTIADAIRAGFDRAWPSIRDSNISTIITAFILSWFGTSLIKGFALTLGLGVMISMLSAIAITKIFLNAISFIGEGKVARFLFSSGLSK